MPLTASLRDEENERINNILKRLIGLDYVPEMGNDTINGMLLEFGFDLPLLLNMRPEQLILHLQKCHFDWANAEQFADFLMTLSIKLPESGFALKEKAIAIYSFIQSESKTFSLDISNKIATAKQQ